MTSSIGLTLCKDGGGYSRAYCSTMTVGFPPIEQATRLRTIETLNKYFINFFICFSPDAIAPFQIRAAAG
jgi:hypothetical protein